ncbi:hypothetical protein BN946_scf185044.g28 [Trametes cinnabarina]|uniref:Uncharacterized protein n=1 Tax=Pycnoporus cinnabarinus TaxID=5643 RepID=A0A060S1F3_PYCCI|nr:hypothetical protein BN946_scf185044.g28 [Trametes cinnabarina]
MTPTSSATQPQTMASLHPQTTLMYHDYFMSAQNSEPDGIYEPTLPAANETSVKLYKGLCPFCLPQVHPPEPPSTFSEDSPHNIIPVCDPHGMMLTQEEIVLCPPLRDLQELVDWEKKDWHQRLESGVHRARTVPPANALSGRLSCIYTHNTAASFTKRILGHFLIGCTELAYAPPNRISTFPQQLRYLPMYYTEKQKRGVAVRCSGSVALADVRLAKEHGERPPIFELLFKFNSRRTQRVNPFATLVRALAALGDAFLPPALFCAEEVTEGEEKKIVSLPVENPITSYRKLLRELRDLYSRTDADLELEAQRCKMSVGNTELRPSEV